MEKHTHYDKLGNTDENKTIIFSTQIKPSKCMHTFYNRTLFRDLQQPILPSVDSSELL